MSFRLKYAGGRGKIAPSSPNLSVHSLCEEIAASLGVEPSAVLSLSLNQKDLVNSSSMDLVTQHFRLGDLLHVKLAGDAKPSPSPPQQQQSGNVSNPTSAPLPSPSPSLPTTPALPLSLQSLLQPTMGQQELVVCLLHAAFLEAGFTPLPSSPSSVPAMRQSASRFEIRYTAQRQGPGVAVVTSSGQVQGGGETNTTNNPPPCTATLRISFLGTHVVAAACSDTKPQAEVFRLAFSSTDHVKEATTQGEGGGSEFVLVSPRASLTTLNDSLARPLFISLLADVNIEFEAHILSLPLDLRTEILERLDGSELVALGLTCKELNASCGDDRLWIALFTREFPASVSSPSVQADAGRRGWKEVYAGKVRERREVEQGRREAAGRSLRVPPPAPFLPGGHPQWMGGGMMQPPGYQPGVIGGAYDLMPGGGFGMGRGTMGPGGMMFGRGGGPGGIGGPGPGFTPGPFGGAPGRGGGGLGGGHNSWI